MYKKILTVLMTSAMLFVVTGCDFPWAGGSDNGGETAEESAVSEESQNDMENDSETTDNTSENSSDDGVSEDTEEPAAPLEVQEDTELQLDEGQEGAW